MGDSTSYKFNVKWAMLVISRLTLTPSFTQLINEYKQYFNINWLLKVYILIIILFRYFIVFTLLTINLFIILNFTKIYYLYINILKINLTIIIQLYAFTIGLRYFVLYFCIFYFKKKLFPYKFKYSNIIF